MIVIGPRAWLFGVAATPVAMLVAWKANSWATGAGLASVVLLVAVVVDALFAVDPEHIEIERDAPRSVVVDTVGVVSWVVTNRGARRADLAVADSLFPSFGAPRRFVMSLTPDERGTALVDIRPSRRGRFELESVTVRTFGPMRVGARQRGRTIADTIRVVPAFHSKREVELRMQRARLLDIGSRSVRAFGGGTEFDQLRDYSPDDQFRNIDWAATARAGRTIVRQYRAEQHETLLIILDNGRLMAARAGGVTRLEHAMDAVMALASVTDRMGDLVSLVTFDANVHDIVAPSRGMAHLRRFTEEMFDLEPVLGESDYAAMAAEVLARFRRRVTVVLLTDLAPAVVEASLGAAVRALSLRHDVVVGSVVASEVNEWLDTVPGEPAEAHLVAAAAAAVSHRATATIALRAMGAKVIDAEAGRLGPALVDHYLTKKAMGR
ncbi:MAG: DUF58 domain-containing protein [Actinomycetia bacterium]|nr:DUF58 domain-containing protein [Actinomycetes bacterium]